MAGVRLVQLDGKLPNLALMKLTHWHHGKGDSVWLSHTVDRPYTEPVPDKTYGSAIFTASLPKAQRLAQSGATVGGTGSGDAITAESLIGEPEYEHYDYSMYPEYRWSLGFSQRGCRLKCGFCVVPKKEGRPKAMNTIPDIWRGDPHARCVVLLDNDFFGQPMAEWRARIQEIRDGGFKASFNQGLNVRLLSQEQAEALATIEYRDADFRRRRLYTAWDNVGDERHFFGGVERLEKAGVPAEHLMVYMLVGWAPGETMDRILYRYRKLKDAGCMPFPMVYGTNPLLKRFQRWVVRRYDEIVPWEEFKRGKRKHGAAHATLPDGERVNRGRSGE